MIIDFISFSNSSIFFNISCLSTLGVRGSVNEGSGDGCSDVECLEGEGSDFGSSEGGGLGVVSIVGFGSFVFFDNQNFLRMFQYRH